MAATRRQRSLIGLVIVVGLGVLGYVYVAEPLQEWKRAAAEQIPNREALLERRRLLVAQRTTLAAEIAEADKRIGTVAPRWLKGPTPALAASELQTLVKGLSDQAGTEVRSERILPPADRGELLEIPVEIAVSCEIRQLVDLLARLDNAPKILPVQELKIRVVNLTQPKDLLVTLTVSGFLLQAAPGKAKS